MFYRWNELEQREVVAGYQARFVHSERMTFVSWRIAEGAPLPEHDHPHEQVAQVLEGQFELTISGVTRVLGPGEVAVIPPNARHSGRAITDCRLIDTFCPVREDYRNPDTGPDRLRSAATAQAEPPTEAIATGEELPDYRYDAGAYEEEELARPDEVAMLRGAAEEACRRLDAPSGGALLDLCCGTGLSLRDVIGHPRVVRVLGVDNCPPYLARAHEQLAGAPDLQLIEGDAVETPLPEGSWDVVMLASAYHHIEDSRKLAFLKRVRRLLAPGGHAVFAENILPPYRLGDAASYRDAVSRFYEEVLVTAEAGNPHLPHHVRGLIRRVAKYGHDGDYEYKVCLDVFLRHLSEAGLGIVRVRKVWPTEGPLSLTTGGNYVVVATHAEDVSRG